MEVRERTRTKAQNGPPTWSQPITTGTTRIQAWFARKISSTFRSLRRFVLKEWRAATTPPRPAQIMTWLAYAYLACAILAWILIWGFGDSWWPGTVLLFIGRWILLLPLIVLVPAGLVLRRTAIIPLVLAALIVVGPVMGFQTGWRRWLLHPAGIPIRVVTFNAETGAALAMGLEEQLEEWSADIIAIQECGPSLREAIGGLAEWQTHEENGVCLITRYPITAVAVMDRSGFAFMREFDPNDIGGSADVTRYTLATSSGLIDVTTVHLETPRKGLEGFLSGGNGRALLQRLQRNTELRDVESHMARAWVERGNKLRLVIGDFNTPIESRIFQRNWGGLKDAFSEVGFGLGMTKDNGWIRVRIDHVLYGAGWHAKRVAVGPNLGSDHHPVIVDLVLERRK